MTDGPDRLRQIVIADGMVPGIRPPGRDIDLLFVAGMSGAGRGTVAKLLEDSGWYVADNVPPSLIDAMVAVARADDPEMSRMALVVRSGVAAFGDDLIDVREEMEAVGVHPRLLFLDADDAALVRRFEQVRRRHPMQDNGTLMTAITQERRLLTDVAQAADLVVDTSTMSVTALREVIDNAFAAPSSTRVRITVQSFGFKYGLPIDADLVADMRFLPNPYWVPELREQNGLDSAVARYVLGRPGASDYLDAYERIVRLTARGYSREGKRYMTVAIGCTGGKHRSVAMSRELARRLSAPDPGADTPAGAESTALDTRVVHRDLGRE